MAVRRDADAHEALLSAKAIIEADHEQHIKTRKAETDLYNVVYVDPLVEVKEIIRDCEKRLQW